MLNGEGLGNHVGVQISPYKGAILRGKRVACCTVWGLFAMSCAKMAELIEMPFGHGLAWAVGSMYLTG